LTVPLPFLLSIPITKQNADNIEIFSLQNLKSAELLNGNVMVEPQTHHQGDKNL
jgi:hypothetical protein